MNTFINIDFKLNFPGILMDEEEGEFDLYIENNILNQIKESYKFEDLELHCTRYNESDILNYKVSFKIDVRMRDDHIEKEEDFNSKYKPHIEKFIEQLKQILNQALHDDYFLGCVPYKYRIIVKYNSFYIELPYNSKQLDLTVDAKQTTAEVDTDIDDILSDLYCEF